jgi:hypothetical protein
MKRLLIGLFCAVLSHAVFAGSLDAIRKQVQASTVVTGVIDVASDGHVLGYTIDRPEKLPEAVVGLIKQGVPTWKFEPAVQDGKPVQAKAKMSIRVVAKYLDKEHMTVGITGAQFEKANAQAGESVSYGDRAWPHYPADAVRARVSGTVYLLLRVGPQGQVEDAVAQQVNLALVDTEAGMEHWRKVLADASLRAAKRWTFHPPTSGEHLHDPYWVARVPVKFTLRSMGARKEGEYGQWDAYVPGPIQPVMWPDKDKMFSGAADAMAGDGLFQLDQGLHLNTPLNGA